MTLMTPLMPLSKMATANAMVLVFLLVLILMLLTSSTLHSPLAYTSSSPLGSSLSIVTFWTRTWTCLLRCNVDAFLHTEDRHYRQAAVLVKAAMAIIFKSLEVIASSSSS